MPDEKAMIELVQRETTPLTLDAVKLEYMQLRSALEESGSLWASWVLNKGEARLSFLRTRIADIVCGLIPENSTPVENSEQG